MLANGVTWLDDWFAIETIAEGVIAIGEPRFHQINWNYLIAGERRALLFDTGPGVRDIAEAVRKLTNLPVTALPSHLHFDHTGNLHRFRDIAMVDLPILRASMRDGWLDAGDDLFRGFREGMVWKPVRVGTWLTIGSAIDLGNRALEIIHTPGHSPDSVSLYDSKAGMLFAADFVYPGPLYAQIPGADLGAYLDTANALLARLDDKTRLFCAHGAPDERGEHRSPCLAMRDVADLANSLTRLRNSGTKPATWPINERMTLLTWEPAFRAWQAPV